MKHFQKHQGTKDVSSSNGKTLHDFHVSRRDDHPGNWALALKFGVITGNEEETGVSCRMTTDNLQWNKS